MSDRIHLSSPDVGDLEEEFLLNALRSGWIAPLGPDVDAFERELARRVGVSHGVALSSGTAALHLALLALGVGEGDIVLTSTMTFAATANAIRYTGAHPYFVDSDATGNVSAALLEDAAGQLVAEGRPAKAIVPVDLLGKVCDYAAIDRVARKFDVPIVVDSAESLGSSRNGQAAGSFGRVSVISFNGNKIMTTSGGGMFLTDDGGLASRARYLASQARQPVAHYEHTDIGYNYRMSNLLAALGRAQLLRLDAMIANRRRHREAYRALFSSTKGVTLFGGTDDSEDNCWLSSILVDPQITGWSTTDLARYMSEGDIEVRPLWKPMHLQPVFATAERLTDGTSERLFRNGLTLPSGSSMTEKQFLRVADRLESFLSARL